MSRLRLLVCSGALALSACTVGPNFKTPEALTAGGYAAPGDAPPPADQRITLGARIEGDWWAQFHSTTLNDLIQVAIDANQARLAECAAAHGRSCAAPGCDRWPDGGDDCRRV